MSAARDGRACPALSSCARQRRLWHAPRPRARPRCCAELDSHGGYGALTARSEGYGEPRLAIARRARVRDCADAVLVWTPRDQRAAHHLHEVRACRRRSLLARADRVDPDEAPPLDREWFETAEIRDGERLVRPARAVGRPKKAAPKKAVNIRLDPEVLAHFRATGPGWQSRINEALRKAAGLMTAGAPPRSGRQSDGTGRACRAVACCRGSVRSGQQRGSVRPPAAPESRRVLRVRAAADLQVLDPAHRKGQPEGDILRCLFPRLIEYRTGDQWGWRLGAAEAIEQDGPTRVRFTLRPGILFTGGFGEMTADDVKFSYERIADPASESEYRDDFAALDRVEVAGPLRGRDRAEGAVRAALDQHPAIRLGLHSEPQGGRAGRRTIHDRAAGDRGAVRHQGVAAEAAAHAGAQPRLERRARRLRRDPDPADRGREGGRDRVRGGRARLHRDQRQLDPGLPQDRRPASSWSRKPRSTTSGSASTSRRRPSMTRGCGARCSGRSTSTRCSRRRISASPGARPGSSRPG